MRNAQLRRGLYALAPPYLKATPHPFHVAGRLVLGSYVSLQSALAWHDLIPEHVPVTTSVTSSRPGVWKTPLGVFEYRHLRWARGGAYLALEVAAGQPACVARPEQALLDLIYLRHGDDLPAHLSGLRLQNLDLLDLERLAGLARGLGKPRLMRAAQLVAELASEQAREYRAL